MKKKIITILATFILAVVLSVLMDMQEAKAANVDLETFIKSVKAGEFVLSDEQRMEFETAVKSGDRDKELQIYREYFHESVEETAEVKTETAAVKAEADELAEEEAEEVEAAQVSDSGESYEQEDEEVEDTYIDENEYFTSEDAEDVVDPDGGEAAGTADSAAREIVLTDADYMALCKIVQAEAGGQGEMGKLLIANVILNRVNSPRFPNTVCQVVAQHGQFTPVRNGRYAAAVPDAETIRAVDRALNGENHAVGICYFKSIRSKSNWSHKVLAFVYGMHMFYY